MAKSRIVTVEAIDTTANGTKVSEREKLYPVAVEFQKALARFEPGASRMSLSTRRRLLEALHDEYLHTDASKIGPFLPELDLLFQRLMLNIGLLRAGRITEDESPNGESFQDFSDGYSNEDVDLRDIEKNIVD